LLSFLFVCQFQQVIEAELAFYVLEVIPAPLRYHLGLTPAASAGAGRAGAAVPPG
jgi:hypothetical protein